ncbi:MAG TPA: DsbA family protein [Candidatus Saccharibacteria bacterium]|nr:DsbA family protein [Candidatus Saccharibacteria bacterium]HRK93800.1 DsbA family protein [Candidatus Saccharibacteria bacterium]
MTTKAWIIFVAICVVVFGGLLVWSQRDRIDVSKVSEASILSGTAKSGDIGDHVKGTKDSKVVLIEYGDFQCPGCEAAYPVVKSLAEKYGDKIAIVFRNFPLTNAHPNARAASAAAEAAGLKGKFWEMHDKLFENQSEWADASTSERGKFFERYATEIGLDGNEFTTSLGSQSGRLNQKISFDQALGRKIKVDGTPAFFLNGAKLAADKVSSEESFSKVIEAEMEKQGISTETDKE